MKRSREPEDASTLASWSNAEVDGTIDASLHTAKIAELDLSDNDLGSGNTQIRCSLPPHKEPVAFSSYDEYETHYRDQHTNRCIQCRKNFPSSHLLNVHIEETHDSFVQAKRERGERTVSPKRYRSERVPGAIR
jgi:hypothetical protein